MKWLSNPSGDFKEDTGCYEYGGQRWDHEWRCLFGNHPCTDTFKTPKLDRVTKVVSERQEEVQGEHQCQELKWWKETIKGYREKITSEVGGKTGEYCVGESGEEMV